MIDLNIITELGVTLTVDWAGVTVTKDGDEIAKFATDPYSGSIFFVTEGVDIQLEAPADAQTDEALRLLRGVLRLRGHLPTRDQFDLDCEVFNAERIESETGPDASLLTCDSCGRSEVDGLITGSSAELLPMYAFKRSGLVFCPACSRLEIKALKASRVSEALATVHPP